MLDSMCGLGSEASGGLAFLGVDVFGTEFKTVEEVVVGIAPMNIGAEDNQSKLILLFVFCLKPALLRTKGMLFSRGHMANPQN